MDNDDIIVGSIFGRREAMRIAARVGIGLAAVGIAGCTAGAGATQAAAPLPPPDAPPPSPSNLLLPPSPRVHLVASPAVTEGPFFVDEKLNRSDIRAGTDRPSVVNGLPLLLAFRIQKLVGDEITPLTDAWVDVWQADALGVYSDESNPMNHENTSHQTWLRGYQKTDAQGLAKFTTIFPGWYMGRAPHIHFKVRRFNDDVAAGGSPKTAAEFTSQLFFREEDAARIYARPPYKSGGRRDKTNRTDDVYNERLSDGSTAGSHLLLDLTSSPGVAGHAAEFSVVLTDEAMRPGRRGRGDGPGGPGGPGGGGPRGRGERNGPPPGERPPPFGPQPGENPMP